MFKLAKYFALTLVVIAANATVFPQNQVTGKPTMTIATMASYPPMEFLSNDNTIVGFDIDLANAIGKIIGCDFFVKDESWTDIYAKLNNSNCDAIMSAIAYSEERNQVYDLSVPYMNGGQILVVRQSDTTTRSLKDLAKKRVGVYIEPRGDYGLNSADLPKFVVFQEIDKMFAALVSGRIDGIITLLPEASRFSLPNEYSGKLRRIWPVIAESPYCLVFRKRDQRYLTKINSAILQLQENGFINALLKKWDLID